jgi:pyruvate/2-oxoacid:ferredoxin oxidoreductase beta subunit
MKTHNTFLSTIVKSIGILTFVFLIACSTGNERKLEDDFQQQKKEFVDGLEKLEADIDEAIYNVEDELNINEGRPIERNFEEIQTDLKQKKKEVQASIAKAKSATKDNWESIKNEVNKASNNVKDGFNKLKQSISDALDGDK